MVQRKVWQLDIWQNIFTSYDEVVRDGNFTRAAESSMYTKKPHGDAIFDQYNDAWKVLNLKGDEDWWCTKKPLL